MIVRRLLSSPVVYKAHMHLLGGRHLKKSLLGQYLRTAPGDRLLDVGCGPAPDRDLLGDVRWTGIELETRYVDHVARHLRDGDRIVHGDVASMKDVGDQFDVVLISGILHHLTDETAGALLREVQELLAPNAYALTIDPVRTQTAGRLERWLIDKDRGDFVRDLDGYRSLVPDGFARVATEIHERLSWIPQAQLVMVLDA